MGREDIMITLKSKAEIAKMKQACELLAQCHKEIGKLIRPGISTLEIDRFGGGFSEKAWGNPGTKGVSRISLCNLRRRK